MSSIILILLSLEKHRIRSLSLFPKSVLKYRMRFLKGTNFYLLILSVIYINQHSRHGGCQGIPAPQHGMHQEMNQMHKSRHLFPGAGWAPQHNTSFLMLHSGNPLHSACSFSSLGHQKQGPEIKRSCNLSRKAIKCGGKRKYFKSVLSSDKC